MKPVNLSTTVTEQEDLPNIDRNGDAQESCCCMHLYRSSTDDDDNV